MQHLVIYALYSGDLYGTEQMAIAHLRALGDAAGCVIFAPEGPVHDAAAALGIRTLVTRSRRDVFRETLKMAWRCRRLSFLSTSATQAFIGLAAAALSPFTRFRHLNICHGGEEAERSFGNKRVLNRTPVRLVAVSAYCAGVLEQFRVPARRIMVVQNFLADERIADAPRRTASGTPLRALVACRLVRVKCVGLLLDAMKLQPGLVEMIHTRVLGTGPMLESLHAASEGLNFSFEGFRNDVPTVMGECDVFVQTWADEPFGLAVVEAMAAGLIVVTPDRGGAAEIVGDERHGVFYRSNDAASLAQALLRVARMPEPARAVLRHAAAARARACYSASARRERLLQVFIGPAALPEQNATLPA